MQWQSTFKGTTFYAPEINTKHVTEAKHESHTKGNEQQLFRLVVN